MIRKVIGTTDFFYLFMDQFLQTMAQNDRESLLQVGMELYF